MNRASYQQRACLKNSSGILYFFGRHGYIAILDGVAVAHITEPAAFLRDGGFGDELARGSGSPQVLIVSQLGLKGMLEHLGVSPYSKNQKESALYQRFTGHTQLLDGLQNADFTG